MTLWQRTKSVANRVFGKTQQRGYRDIVSVGGNNGDWVVQSLSEDADLWQNAYALTARCRDLFKTNPLYIKYRELLWANVFGSEGHMLRMKIQETENRVVNTPDAKRAQFEHEERINRIRRWAAARAGTQVEEYRAFKLADELEKRDLDTVLRGTALIQVGAPDVYANQLIERAFTEWQRKEFSDIRGTRNYQTQRQLRLIGSVRDGDFFIRLIRDPAGKLNKFGFSLQMINAEWCDRFYNATLPGGNVVVMGIEYQMTAWGLGPVVAYHFIKRVPQDWQWTAGGGLFGLGPESRAMRQRVLASEIIHYARPVDAESTRPAPWVASTIPKGRQLDQYELAEVVAAREQACKTGFLWSDVNPEGGMSGQAIDPRTGLASQPLAPGETGALPWGVKYQERNPTHPTMNFESFRKGMVRSLTAGMPAADYNTLANDLENINFSAGRLGRLDTNEMSKLLQRFDIDTAERPIFEAWLESALITGAVPLPLAKFNKFNKPVFQGRRWAQVDEIKAVNASALRIANKLSSRNKECAEEGIDFEDNAFELAEEEMILEQLGLETATTVEGQKPSVDAQDTADGQAAPTTGDTKKPAPKKDSGTKEADEMTTDQFRDILATELDARDKKIVPPAPPVQPPSITVNVPEIRMPAPVLDMSGFKLPEQKAPVVNVAAAQVRIPEIKMPEAAPIVVNVSPTPVNITNEVKVPAASSVKIRRNKSGEMTGADIERT